MKRYLTLILFPTLLCAGFAQAQEIEFTGKNLLLGTSLQILEDKNGSYTPQTANSSSQFVESQWETPNFGNTNSTYWVKMQIRNNSNNEKLYLELGTPMWDTCNMYEVGESGPAYVETISSSQSFFSRNIKHPNPVFDLNIAPGKSKEYLLKLKTNELTIVPLILYEPISFLESSMIRELIAGIHIGVLMVMMFYNLFVYFSIKEETYLYYVLYILFIGLTQTTLFGYTFKYFWPNAEGFNNQVYIYFPALAGIFGIFFAKSFLNSTKTTPFLDKLLGLAIIPYGAAIVLRMLGFDIFSYRMIDVGGTAASVLAFLMALKLSIKGNRPAKIFLLAWSILLVGLVLFSLRNLNILPYNIFTNYTMQLGTAIEVLILSIALADKINTLKRERESAQEEALNVSKENERIINNQNIILEKTVDERTSKLQKSNEELNVTLNKLRDAQGLLIESEKMASLGQLTAGIAHEINNPINFVSSNISPLQRDIYDIMDVLTEYEKLKDVTDPATLKAELERIDKFKEDLDIEYIKSEIDLLLTGMKDGSLRTVEIVKGLKIFSRIDSHDLNVVNINEGLESTLVLLNNQINPDITLTKDLGNLPDVQCYPGKLNQVFMNIITNAIHAVLDNPSPKEPPAIWVSTSLEDEHHVKISIRDNGTGIPEKVKSRIFEPFFTTKEVGKGTGLGLSIVFKIIEAHGGHIKLISEENKGTEFIITLPIKKEGLN